MIRIGLLSALSATVLAAGCQQEYKGDTITLRAGNSMRANAAIMTVDPQAHRADNTHISTNGRHVQNVMKTYRGTTGLGTAQKGASAPGAEGVLEGAANSARGY